ncbi:hypothetical protein [Hufsiella ginkgonis]|uniref:Uncharacterized protein n=1 Tax=Hufsiella ginkgonis TaxID=2695274 RepID=A0A7K1Y1C3_9SPHI|nr:hypothetical protein [Hufsiella ginkgonis]MXV16819.1 hypothetical protein [Hufsiella ginkgonis]
MLIIAVSLMWFFVYKFGGASDQVNINCEAEKAQLRSDLATVRQEKDDLVQALLVKNGIINEIKRNTDSLVRNRVGNEAKQIIKR